MGQSDLEQSNHGNEVTRHLVECMLVIQSNPALQTPA